MRKTILGVAAVGAVAGFAAVRRRAKSRDAVSAGHPDRWHSVTVNCEPEQLGHLPPPLDDLGFAVEVRIRPAPGDRGTELAARVAPSADAGSDAVGELRAALRKARALAEIGEIPLPDAPSTTEDTLLSRPLAHVTRHGREEGRL